MIRILYSPQFQRQVKKLHQLERTEVKKVVLLIAQDPSIGSSKRHNLSGISVYKFWLSKQEILIAYRDLTPEAIRFLKIGPHENFDRDLKREN